MPAHPKPAPKAKKPGAMRRAKTEAAQPDQLTVEHIPPSPIAWPSGAVIQPEHTADPGPTAPGWHVKSAPAAAGSKTDLIIAMLKAGTGATSKQLEAATGWAPHSVRGLLGTLRKRGVNVISTKVPKQPTVYHIATAVAVDVI
jgi:hypothetical protein